MKAEEHHLFHGETAHAWHRRVSPDFPPLAREGAFAVLPVYRFLRYHPDWPLEAEECLGARVLAAALRLRPPSPPFLILPPLRHTPALEAGQSFTVGLAQGNRLVAEIVRSVARSGIRRVILLHVHPRLADWLDATARDLRVETGAALYRIDLSATGLDLDDKATRDSLAPAGENEDCDSPLAPVAGRLDSLFGQIVRHTTAREGGRA